MMGASKQTLSMIHIGIFAELPLPPIRQGAFALMRQIQHYTTAHCSDFDSRLDICAVCSTVTRQQGAFALRQTAYTAVLLDGEIKQKAISEVLVDFPQNNSVVLGYSISIV